MKIAFDMSSVIWTCLYAGKDPEGHEITFNEKKVTVPTAAFGYEHAINRMVSNLERFDLAPKDAVLVFEGMQSKKPRLQIDPQYKANRGQRPDEVYGVFQDLREILETTWRGLGALCISQRQVEADDILGYLAENAEEPLVISTYDNDLSVLNGVNSYQALVQVLVGSELAENKYGPFPFKFITLYKALVGDASDNIKGCPGFGPAAWLKLCTKYDDYGCEQLVQLLEDRNLTALEEDLDDPTVAKIYEHRNEVIKSYQLAKIHPEWVNTLHNPLEFKPGMAIPYHKGADERLAHWYGRKYLVTADKFDRAIAWMRPEIAQSEYVGLDIETSTPDESDDWLLEQKKRSGSDELGVDVIASELTGLSLTFGKNLQHTMYFPVDHRDTNNVSSEKVCELVYQLGVPLVIQNAAGFELPVLHLNWGQYLQSKGFPLFLPQALDTRIEASYVNENVEHGLKQSSLRYLGYTQVDYKTVTTIQVGTAEDGSPITAQVKMRDLTGQHVLNYACDDTITCTALHNFYKFHMQLEHQYQTYLEAEIDAMYLGADAFVKGVPCSLKRLSELDAHDQEVYDRAWSVFRKFLVDNGWEGSVPPVYTSKISAAEIKEAFQIVTGEPLESRDRLPAKLAAAAEAQGHPLFSAALKRCVESAEGAEQFTQYVRRHFKGEPEWKNSPQKKSKVLYEMLGLPIRLRNDATEKMRQAGIREGNPRTDAIALAFALKYDVDERPEVKPIVHAMQEMQVVMTRQGLYYKPYPTLVHWKTGRLHPQIRQSSTNTRRHTAAKPNTQQMSKHPKADGETPKVREVAVPHKKNAVVVSMDFKSQELVVITDYSKDETMLACYASANRRDMHAITGLGILKSWDAKYADWSYDTFMTAYKSGEPEVVEARTYGKKVNFTTEYGAMAPKLAETLIIFEEEAQKYIDAKEAAFPGVRAWKNSVEEEVRLTGIVRTMDGAVRHLGDAVLSEDRYESSKAYRQGVNFKVQGSSAQMTKRAHGAMWRAKLLERFDCQFYFPVHDESVWSCTIEDLFEFLPAVHACMTQAYGNMTVPIESSIAFGKSFGPADQIEIGERPTREAIQKGLDKYFEATK